MKSIYVNEIHEASPLLTMTRWAHQSKKFLKLSAVSSSFRETLQRKMHQADRTQVFDFESCSEKC